MATRKRARTAASPNHQPNQTGEETCYCRFRLRRCHHTLQLIDEELARIDSEGSNDSYSKKMRVEMERGRRVMVETMQEDFHVCRKSSSSSHNYDTMQQPLLNKRNMLRISSMTNEQLAHELLLDPSFRMETEDEMMMDADRRVALVTRDIRDEAFWKATCEALVFASRTGGAAVSSTSDANHPR
jgi:hypothetical protein